MREAHAFVIPDLIRDPPFLSFLEKEPRHASESRDVGRVSLAVQPFARAPSGPRALSTQARARFAIARLCSGARLPSQIVDGDVHCSRNAARQKHQHACLHYPLANDGSRSAAAALLAEKFYRRSIYWQSSEMDDSASRLITKVYAFAESWTVAAAQIAPDKSWSL
jgi:hypothetical protein